MSVTPSDLLHNKKDLNKKIDVEDIDLSEISIEDLVFNKKNYKNYINLSLFLLEYQAIFEETEFLSVRLN